MGLEQCLKEVLTHVDESLQYSIEKVSWVQEESFSRYQGILKTLSALKLEIEDVIETHKRIDKLWRQSRHNLLKESQQGTPRTQKDAYDEAEQLMFQKGRIEERERMLSQRRNDLQREQRHLERIMKTSKEMIEKMQVALELIHAEKERSTELASEGAEMIHSALRIFEREQAWLSRELHDGPIQEMAATMLMTELVEKLFEKGNPEDAIKEVRDIRKALEGSLGELRSLLWRFRPGGMGEHLFEGLKLMARQVQNRYGALCEITWEGASPRVSAERTANLFRVVQEAMINAIVKGKAKKIHVEGRVPEEEGELHLLIEDDGSGFDVPLAKKKARERGSYGLINMEERVRVDGGSFFIESNPGKGTRIKVILPLQEG
ncbi:MAG TPA: histidine kinase [Synergistaceae bacterium]|nr:histidine kinase [Synergistaceae bacterium]HPQ37636.1 histidine kinase [Synergistaceae bacterium]